MLKVKSGNKGILMAMGIILISLVWITYIMGVFVAGSIIIVIGTIAECIERLWKKQINK